MRDICIKSDFTDYYDNLSTDDAVVKYERLLNNSSQRGKALTFLRSLGIDTVQIMAASKYIGTSNKLVVYTDPTKHHSDGKVIMSVDEAVRAYPNYPASQYFLTDGRVSMKYVQVGRKRFNILYRKDEPYTLDPGKIIDLTEISSDYNQQIKLPIFSIDYISINNKMVATDFNEVEQLDRFGLEKFMSAEKVIEEIHDALEFFNRK